MRCDKEDCKKVIDADNENWQRFTVNGVEITLCEKDVKELFKWLRK